MNSSEQPTAPLFDVPEVSMTRLALDGLRDSTGIVGELVTPIGTCDIAIKLHFGSDILKLGAEVKKKVDRFAALEDIRIRTVTDEKAVLITSALSIEMVNRCRELELQFIDTAGNAYLNNKNGIFVYVCGRRVEKNDSIVTEQANSSPTALRLIFALLANPDLLNGRYRDIAEASGVSLGAIGKVFTALEARGFIGITASKKRGFRDKELLLSEWAAGYANRLRPKLHRRRFFVPDPNALMDWKPQAGVSAWGGEMAAAILTKSLKPEKFTIYMDPDARAPLSNLVRKYELKADKRGTLEIVEPFWSMRSFTNNELVVPPELVYADLLATLDPRNIATAKLLRKLAIANA